MSGCSRIGLVDNLRPLVPTGDDRQAASAISNTVLQRSLVWNDELRAIAEKYSDAAPTSSEHVSELNAVISRDVLEWIEEWPQ